MNLPVERSTSDLNLSISRRLASNDDSPLIGVVRSSKMDDNNNNNNKNNNNNNNNVFIL